jgi:hypothetical protein
LPFPQVELTVGLLLLPAGAGGKPLHVRVTLQRPQLRCLVRVSAQPLMSQWPYTGSLGLCLLEPPHIDTELYVAEGEFYVAEGELYVAEGEWASEARCCTTRVYNSDGRALAGTCTTCVCISMHAISAFLQDMWRMWRDVINHSCIRELTSDANCMRMHSRDF